MRRTLFDEEHELFREQCRRFVADEIAPRIPDWNEKGMSDRESWRRAGAQGYLGACVPEQYGGAGAEFTYDAIIMEEMAYARAHGMMISLHSSICLPYILSFGSEEQKTRYVPGCVTGETLLGICMTEPGAGSDLQGLKTRAVRDGDGWVLNGAKTFISNGQIGDLFIVVARTDPDAEKASRGLSLFLVEAEAPGFVRGKKLDKLGLRGQDTSEIFFEDCRVPADALLGEEGRGFYMLMDKLQQERICIGVASIASARRSVDDTVAYVKERHAFGQPIAGFQNTQFTLAELQTEVEVGQAFVDSVVGAHVRGEEVVSEASMAKWWASDLQKRAAAACLQLHGGYGFMSEYPISADYADAAVQSIYAGSNEIMKRIIARRMGLG